jgi:glycosyltransferase involved in cell wall biosynthesis
MDRVLADILVRAPALPVTGEPLAVSSPEISVVVPTWRRPELLARCLHALMNQALAPSSFEIIVCDDGPDEDTRRLVRRLAAELAGSGLVLRYIPVTATQGPAGARNAGWRAARGAIVAFTDDDTQADPNWLASGLQAMRGGADAATGRIHVPLPAEPTDYERDAAGLNHAEFATANCFVSRSMLERVGGFDERYTSAWREDSDLQFSILAAGGQVEKAPNAVVVHPVRPAPWGVSLAQQKKSQFDALLYKKHRQRYKAEVAAPPWRYFFIVASLLAAAAGALSGLWVPAAAAFALWLGLTAGFCLHRLRGTSHRPGHVLEMIWTSVLIPPLSLFWRLRGAVKFRVAFL